MIKTKENIYTIGEVADSLDVSVEDIRHFEDYQLVSPSYKGEYDHYLYNEDDLEDLKFIVTLFKNGFTMEEILEEISQD